MSEDKQMDEIRTLWIEKMLDGTIDNVAIEDCKELAGYNYPEGKQWEVVGLWEGTGMTVDTQEHAEILSNQIAILGLMIKERRRSKI